MVPTIPFAIPQVLFLERNAINASNVVGVDFKKKSLTISCRQPFYQYLTKNGK